MLPFYRSLLHCCSTVFLAARAALPLCYTLRGIAALKYVLHCSIAALQYSLLYFFAGVWLQETINRNNINITDSKLTCLCLLAASSICLGWEMSHDVKDASGTPCKLE
jgi:hypothetical protein